VEFGDGFETARKWGRQAHDDLYPADDGSIFRKTNHAGGIEGGISNGEPIISRAAMKPIATTKAAHQSVDYFSRVASTPIYQRSDVCAVPAASLVGEAMVAFSLAQEMIEKFGGDSLAEMKR
jgi:chorismate synthase